MRFVFEMVRPWALVMATLLAVATGTGCKQGEGEVCQIDNDCEDGLICVAGTMQCGTPGGSVADAAPLADAPPAADAAPEADAPIEADAATADAATEDAGE